MALQVAFLRAINIGNRRVSMDKLRVPFEELGFGDVSTFIASGNVIFTATGRAAELEKKIETALTTALGFDVVTFVRSVSAIGKVVADPPFRTRSDIYVGFLKKAATAGTKSRLESLSNEIDALTSSGKEIYWQARQGMGRATVSGAKIEKALGQPTTLRSLKMLQRLHAKLT